MKKLVCFLLLSMFLVGTALAQTNPVKGIVVSASDGDPLIGVSVSIKGTTTGIMTDAEGRFALQGVKTSDVLVISYLGYKQQEVAVGNNREFMIRMEEDHQMLDEVVVVGYGVQKKSVVTAAISKTTAEDLELVTPTRIEDVLKGKVSGVQVISDSGQPKSGSKVRIRGTGTINDSNPLYIIDGMPVDGGISYLNPTDIQSVEILKDAASAAIYGTRGANGVILVTTKQGTTGKANVNYDFSYGWQNPWKKKAILNAQEYMTIQNEMAINDGGTPRYTAADIASAVTTDWQDATFNYDAPVQSHQVSVNGGNERSQYFLSFGYFDQEGIVGGNYGKSNFERYSLRFNNTYTAFETKERNFFNKVRVGTNIGYTRMKSTSIDANSEWGSVLGSALSFDPTIPVMMTAEETAAQLAMTGDRPYEFTVLDKNGLAYSTPPAGFQEIGNPVGMLAVPNKGWSNEDKFVASFWGEVDIFDGLKFRTSYGADLAFWGNDSYTFPYYLSYQGKWATQAQSGVSSEMNRGYSWQVENFFSYNKTFGLHTFGAVLGQSAQKNTSQQVGASKTDIPTTDPNKAWLNNAIGPQTTWGAWGGIGDATFSSLASYFGRIDYNFDERYMLQATVRRDGSSKFGPNNKWATFPAFSLGWNVLNEAFMEDVKASWFNVLKIRGSWGKNGNQNIGNLRYATFDSTGRNYYFGKGFRIGDGDWTGGATQQNGIYPGTLANPNIRWEESEQIDLGIDLRFLSNALSFTADYFDKKTNGMLMNVPIPSYVGQGAPIGNVGDMKNWGLEFDLGYNGKVRDFNYYITANASYVNTELVNAGNSSGEIYYDNNGASGVGTYVKAENGEVFPYFYGLKTNGIFQNQAEIDNYVWTDPETGEVKKIQGNAKPGDVRFIDLNDDGQINDDDKTKVGKAAPDWTFGFTLGGDWKGFDLSLFFQGSVGNDMFDFAQRGDIPRMNRPEWILQRWHGEGTSNKIPRMTSANPNGNWRSSDIYIKDGSYIRLKNAQFGYTLPKHVAHKISMQRLRVFVAGENLLTFTNYDGFDPEISNGIDRGIYPQSRTISVGVNVSF